MSCHQCLSATSPLGTHIVIKEKAAVGLGHQCLSATGPLGTKLQAPNQSTRYRGHQCLSATSPLGTEQYQKEVKVLSASPMPFGNESTWDPIIFFCIYAILAMSPMPFGNESTWDHTFKGFTLELERDVTNAFRQRVHLGQDMGWLNGCWQESHQCLSATSPLGTPA